MPLAPLGLHLSDANRLWCWQVQHGPPGPRQRAGRLRELPSGTVWRHGSPAHRLVFRQLPCRDLLCRGGNELYKLPSWFVLRSWSRCLQTVCRGPLCVLGWKSRVYRLRPRALLRQRGDRLLRILPRQPGLRGGCHVMCVWCWSIRHQAGLHCVPYWDIPRSGGSSVVPHMCPRQLQPQRTCGGVLAVPCGPLPVGLHEPKFAVRAMCPRLSCCRHWVFVVRGVSRRHVRDQQSQELHADSRGEVYQHKWIVPAPAMRTGHLCGRAWVDIVCTLPNRPVPVG